VKKLVIAVVMCLAAASADAAFGQSGRVGWDGTWVGGWENGTGVQLLFAGETLIGFYFREDYKELVQPTVMTDGGRTFAWDKGEANLIRTPNGGTLLVVHERGKPEVSIPLKRDDAVFERLGDAPNAADVAAIEIGGEAEFGVVGHLDRVRLALEAVERSVGPPMACRSGCGGLRDTREPNPDLRALAGRDRTACAATGQRARTWPQWRERHQSCDRAAGAARQAGQGQRYRPWREQRLSQDPAKLQRPGEALPDGPATFDEFSDLIEEVRFARDSPLEGAVSSEPVSAHPNSLLAGKIQGISSIRGSVARQRQSKASLNQCLTSQFPTHLNREFFWALQGIKSDYLGTFRPEQGILLWPTIGKRPFLARLVVS
jgi:hypothetical protein